MPTAKAGPAGGFDVASGGSVTLEVEGPENDDLWGTNVTYAWAPPAGTTVTYTDGTTANSPRPTFDAPAADGTLTFTLTATGGGGVAATSTVDVRVGATAMGPMPVSAVVDGETLTLTYDRDLQEINPASVPVLSKGPVYLAVLSAPGARRNIETAAPSAVEVTGRQVILTLNPEDAADFGETVTLSYYPDNAVAASRVRGLGGTLADAFTGLRVDNDTPEGNTVQSFAVTGPAKTYRIGDTIGIDVTFAEAVTVVTGGAPTLALEIGAARRKAAYVRAPAAPSSRSNTLRSPWARRTRTASRLRRTGWRFPPAAPSSTRRIARRRSCATAGTTTRRTRWTACSRPPPPRRPPVRRSR